MAKTSGRIAISRNTGQMLELAQKVYRKHVADGNDSQLKALEGDPWQTAGPNISAATARHNEAEELKGQMEAAYRERDMLASPIEEALKSSRNLLKALNAKNPKRLSEWGFEVDDTTKKP